jgi:signal transduction histidine kinase
MLAIMGGQIAAALETLRLLQEARQRAEELAVANATLQAQDELRRELVHQVSHDLRSPLQIVYGYADMLHNAELGPITPLQKDALAIIIKRARAIEALTRDIMAARHISRDMLDLEIIDLNQVCQQAVIDARLVRPPDLPLGFETALAAGPLYIEADYNRLSRVFDNLLGNAIKFSPDGGTVTLRTERDLTRQRALVSVSDQGIGIAADKLPFVFERFFRGNRKQFAGSGLGLYITQQIVAAHQGEVWVASQEGAGSTFTVALPLIER